MTAKLTITLLALLPFVAFTAGIVGEHRAEAGHVKGLTCLVALGFWFLWATGAILWVVWRQW